MSSSVYVNLQRVIQNLIAPTDYYAVYTATIVSVNADKTLDINPANPRWAGMSNVPVYPGVAGCVATCKAGQAVLFSFTDGNPGAPYVLGVLGAPAELDVTADAIKLNGGTHGVARVTDPVRVTAPTSTTISATLDVAHSTITLLSPLVIDGSIQDGSHTVKAGN